MADEDRELDALRAEAEALGVKVDRRWGADRLHEEIEAARGGDDEAQDEPEQVQPEGKRAGGYVNRDDGAGWVLEDGD